MTSLEQRRAAAQEQQRRATTLPAPLFVQACPGAGKTRVIVDRHLAAAGGRRGRAVVSFTNVACDEVTRRCRDAGRPHLADFPNFVGTIDSFLWRYLVRPFLSSDRTWNRIDSWERIGATVDVWDGRRKHILRLSDFQWTRDPGAEHCRAQLQFRTKNAAAYKILESLRMLDAAAERAVRRRNALAKQGHITGHEARILALRGLSQHRRDVTSILTGRFAEVVIDEAQDCSALDLAILAELRDAGIPLVFVCDPDQAIYEFRGALPDRVRSFGLTLGVRVDLVGNWRSSPAICALAATLRPTPSRTADDPVGPSHDERGGVVLIRGSEALGEEILNVFNEYAQARGIALEQRLVLAHAAAKLPGGVRNTAVMPPDNHSARAEWAARVLVSDTVTPAQRETACEILERTILRYWFTDAEVENRTVTTACEQLGVDRSRLRRQAGRMADALSTPGETPSADWCKAANTYLKTTPPIPGMSRRSHTGSLQARTSTTRTAKGTSSAGSPASPRPRASVVHQVKGEEADAVLVIVPSDNRADDLIRAWQSGVHPAVTAESLRVLYVAATRARRLLAIALPNAHCDDIAAHLEAANVSCEIINVETYVPVTVGNP
ncbi:UvrD-helicase domain-containing protein [Amycolatopsis keratiniphila]|uniref:UvrD-helicase domain-containing protein n=1 Tax=Amycolatopsis keratiniphila TaxID=129921 RepID=UPI00087AF7DF|nr:UvrD-helicase domain-containing protein [Amycolatopsis keratiniphila]OLZ58143.1 hypothetical protein BS330_13040 [Amycolatopsis keratiniphila subsp. nogabecina]SDU44453.1 Part of AAA domain-containing protein [Amycolatopsis keratiniphila]